MIIVQQTKVKQIKHDFGELSGEIITAVLLYSLNNFYEIIRKPLGFFCGTVLGQFG